MMKREKKKSMRKKRRKMKMKKVRKRRIIERKRERSMKRKMNMIKERRERIKMGKNPIVTNLHMFRFFSYSIYTNHYCRVLTTLCAL